MIIYKNAIIASLLLTLILSSTAIVEASLPPVSITGGTPKQPAQPLPMKARSKLSLEILDTSVTSKRLTVSDIFTNHNRPGVDYRITATIVYTHGRGLALGQQGQPPAQKGTPPPSNRHRCVNISVAPRQTLLLRHSVQTTRTLQVALTTRLNNQPLAASNNMVCATHPGAQAARHTLSITGDLNEASATTEHPSGQYAGTITLSAVAF